MRTSNPELSLQARSKEIFLVFPLAIDDITLGSVPIPDQNDLKLPHFFLLFCNILTCFWACLEQGMDFKNLTEILKTSEEEHWFVTTAFLSAVDLIPKIKKFFVLVILNISSFVVFLTLSKFLRVSWSITRVVSRS